ncbi:hypothetical protein [Sphingobium aquiterrae]|uniref:hypothetical protein n=1 Tax=Sphingobium aquiterrae TaxID=2038656 RepID=UPI0030165437
MDRRRFLAVSGGGVAAASVLAAPAAAAADDSALLARFGGAEEAAGEPLCSFTDEGCRWTVHEDRAGLGPIRFVADDGAVVTLAKRLEPVFAGPEPAYLGLTLEQVALADADLLADRLLAHGGDPDPERVRVAAPPPASMLKSDGWGTRLPWTAFVGTRQAGDTMPVFPNGRTRTYRPEHDFPELTDDVLSPGRSEGLIGGWLPAVHKRMPRPQGGEYDLLTFADTDYYGRFYVHTWHRTRLIEGGRVMRETFGNSHARFPSRRANPGPEDFYRALLRFARSWSGELAGMARATLPDPSWTDMVAHAFAKELVVRPGGDYPKYGVVDRDYYGSEYDGFQDTFTSSLLANLEWGRFAQARAVLDQFFTEFVTPDGLVDMRGPEVPQYGLTLSLIARYAYVTGDLATLIRHRDKIRESARLLADLHDAGLALAPSSPGHGLLHGWSESDACLHPDPTLWWKPYWNNSAFAVRGWRDLAEVWPALGGSEGDVRDWRARADRLNARLVEAVRANIRRDLSPPYLGPLPGVRETFRQALSKGGRSEQGWPHRVYAELLHADVLPDDLAGLVVDCLRGHGGTTLGVVANIGRPSPRNRSILGFISYGYARALLRLDRIEEYLLFLYAHRYHDHTPGGWVAGEVAGITGSMPIFCIPAQLTIPKLVRWMLAFEDDGGLHLLRAVPRDWIGSGKPVGITSAPTRWGRADVSVQLDRARGVVTGQVALHGKPPPQATLRLRLPKGLRIAAARINGRAVRPVGETLPLAGAADGRYAVTVQVKGTAA